MAQNNSQGYKLLDIIKPFIESIRGFDGESAELVDFVDKTIRQAILIRSETEEIPAELFGKKVNKEEYNKRADILVVSHLYRTVLFGLAGKWKISDIQNICIRIDKLGREKSW